MIEWFTDIFGVYSPCEVIETVGEVESVKYMTDWGYILPVVIFGVALWGMFILIRSVIK